MIVLLSGFGPKPRNKVDKFDSGENHDRDVSAFEKVLLFYDVFCADKNAKPAFSSFIH